MFKSSNIILPINKNETKMIVRDADNNNRYTYYGDTISAMYIENNFIKIKTKSENSIQYLDFVDTNDAIIALSILESCYTIIKENFKKSMIVVDNKTIFSFQNNNLTLGQQDFIIPNSFNIKNVYYNGLFIDYTFDNTTNNVHIDNIIVNNTDILTVLWY
jgi:hypothetical protein